MQIGFYFNQTRCTGCGACQVACKDWNDVPAGPEKWMRVQYTEKGKFPDVFVSYLASTCWHCVDPVCIPACPVNAISKRKEDGIVIVNSNTCVGNEACDEKCRKACPYDAPQFAEGVGTKMQKCHFCSDRWQEGKIPSCVEACPTRALDAGDMDELIAKYGEIREAEAFKYNNRVKPSVIFKPKINS